MKYTRQAGLVFLLLAFMYVYYYQDPQANGNTRLDLAFAIVQDGRLNIDSFVNAPGTQTIDVASNNGHYYTDKAIGSSLLAAVFYAPLYLFMKLTGHQFSLLHIKYILTALVISLPSAFAGSLVYVMCETISGSRLRALIATLAVTLGTMVLPFSAIFFGHQLAGALCFTAFFLLYQLKLKPSLQSKWGYHFGIGLLLGYAFLTEYTTAVIILPLCLYFFYLRQTKLSFSWVRRLLLPFALGAAVPLAVLMLYNTLSFGGPLSIGYENLANQYRTSMSQGFMGISWPRLEVLFYITFHPAMGLFWQSPVLLLSMVGLVFMWRDKHYRPETLIVVVAFVGFLLINAGYFMWWGGYSFGPRHLIPMLLFLALPLVMLPRKLDPLVVILLAISFVQMLIPLAGSMLAPDTYFAQNAHLKFFGYSTIYDYSWKQLLAGNFAYNLGSKLLRLKGWLIMLPNITAVLFVVAIFIAGQHLKPRSKPTVANQSPIQ
jgi:hypothetical protein